VITFKRLASASALAFFLLFSAVRAQDAMVSTVNVTPEPGRIRVAAVGEVYDLKVEVLDEAGETVFEGAAAAGRRLDWVLRDARGARVPPGTYTVTVSYVTQAGRQRKRIEQVTVTGGTGAEGESAPPEPQAGSDPTPQAVGPITGQGTAGKLAKFTGANSIDASLITESTGKIGLNIAPPAARLHVNGPTPPPLDAGGTAATPLLQTSGGKGGSTTGTDGRKAGPGASLLLVAGNGGDAPAGSQNGSGGSITLQPGAGGGGAGTAGASGKVLLVPNRRGLVGVGTSVPTSMLHVVATDNIAVHGDSTDIGVYGVNHTDGVGVSGSSPSGYGVKGQSSAGYAGYFQGRVRVVGNLSASGNVGIGTTNAGGAKLKVQGGDVFIAWPRSLIIASTDGQCWKIVVSNNTGALSSDRVDCP
jgi:hypothetical protein